MDCSEEGHERVSWHDKCNELVQQMLNAFKAIGTHMSLKIHFMNSHMDVFQRQMPTESDEQGERFHQVCKPFETNYKGKQIHALIADLCWSLTDDGVGMKRGRKRRLTE